MAFWARLRAEQPKAERQRLMVACTPLAIVPKRPRTEKEGLTPSWRVLCSRHVMESVMRDVIDDLWYPLVVCCATWAVTASIIFVILQAHGAKAVWAWEISSTKIYQSIKPTLLTNNSQHKPTSLSKRLGLCCQTASIRIRISSGLTPTNKIRIRIKTVRSSKR